jgi:hypothetical protein
VSGWSSLLLIVWVLIPQWTWWCSFKETFSCRLRFYISKVKDILLSRYRNAGAKGGEGIAPTHSWSRHWILMSGQGHVPATFNPGKKVHGTHCTGGWVGPRAGLDTEVRGKILGDWTSFVQTMVRHYTVWATPVSFIQTGHNTESHYTATTSCRVHIASGGWVRYHGNHWGAADLSPERYYAYCSNKDKFLRYYVERAFAFMPPHTIF